MTTPVAERLRLDHPSAHIAWVVEEKSKDALVGNPFLDEVIVWSRNSRRDKGIRKWTGFIFDLAKLRRELRARKFDVTLDLQGLLRSGLAGFLSGAKNRFGGYDAREFAAMFYNSRANLAGRKPAERITVRELTDAFCEKGKMHFPVSASDREFAKEFLASVSAESGLQAYVGLCPATTWPQKHWTVQGWADLADTMVSKYGLLPVFFGSKADTEMITKIRSLMKEKAATSAGLTTLNQAAAIIEQCRLVVAVDTALLHVSMALDRPAIGIFGPTVWGHFCKKDNFRAVAKTMDCMPCLRHPTCSDFTCMKDITAQEVILAAGEWLPDRIDGDQT